MASDPGTLFVVSTPIGNLDDITLRALRVLRDVDVIAAEDTRHSLKLLSHFGISKPLMSYWGGREQGGAERVMKRLQAGDDVALVSDAGTPGIADPGFVLIKQAIAEGVRICPVPGASACIAALTLSGFAAGEFLFCGFLPSRGAERRRRLEGLVHEERTIILYEAPHRLKASLADMGEAFGERRAVLVREITKLHEEVLRGSVSGIAAAMSGRNIRGEFVMVIEGSPGGCIPGMEPLVEEVKRLVGNGLSRKEAVRRVAGHSGASRKTLYDRSLRE